MPLVHYQKMRSRGSNTSKPSKVCYIGGGPSSTEVPSFGQRVGAAAIHVDLSDDGMVTDLGFHISLVPGRQNVPRAETQGLMNALSLTLRDEPEVQADATYVVNSVSQLQDDPSHEVLDSVSGDMWNRVADETQAK